MNNRVFTAFFDRCGFFMIMKRVFAYIDGFNFYHRIDDYLKYTTARGKPDCLKWLNYWDLAQSLIVKDFDKLEKVIFFTAVCEDFGIEAKNRHLRYLDALRSNNVEIVFGKFKRRNRKCKVLECNNPNKIFIDREEKRTDVNIAVHAVRNCLKNEFDKLLLFSADTDLIPAIEILLQEGKEVVPVRLMTVSGDSLRWDYNSEEIPKACRNSFRNVKWKTLRKHLLPETLIYNGKAIQIPFQYKTKP
jgi:uncharacterized LabA/DUF88 family protein